MTSTPSPAIWWVRRDLRLADNPALLAAAGALGPGTPGSASPGSGTVAPGSAGSTRPVLAVFVLDDALLAASGIPRREYLMSSLAHLDASTGGRLLVVSGRPEEVLPAVVAAVGACEVHIAADFGPYGAVRDTRVEQALGDVPLIRTGSPYAVAPGRVRKGDGDPYRVFTPFRRAWSDHGWRAPATATPAVEWADPAGLGLATEIPSEDRAEPLGGRAEPLGDRAEPLGDGSRSGGEVGALARWRDFLDDGLADYATDRDRPEIEGTSRLSAALRWGEIHPRTLLADLARHDGEGADTFRSELAWREFFADALHHAPETARTSLHPVVSEDDWADGEDEREALELWAAGRTGYPFVDAGMRQLAATGWMHGRVRMVTASFLVKDLHVRWQRGARHFMRHLVDGDLASNQLNWQWVAGTGLDAAPYHRIFNPVTQGRRFDPSGSYVRRWVPELSGIAGGAVHEPWRLDSPPADYPAPVVDHAVERRVALEAFGRRPR